MAALTSLGKKEFVMKKLPSWRELEKNFPNKSVEEVFTEIGGKVKLNYDIGVFKNACATRISKA